MPESWFSSTLCSIAPCQILQAQSELDKVRNMFSNCVCQCQSPRCGGVAEPAMEMDAGGSDVEVTSRICSKCIWANPRMQCSGSAAHYKKHVCRRCPEGFFFINGKQDYLTDELFATLFNSNPSVISVEGSNIESSHIIKIYDSGGSAHALFDCPCWLGFAIGFYVSPKCSTKASRGAKANCTEFAEDPFKVWSEFVQRAATFESQKALANWAVSKASTQRMRWIA